MIPLPWRFFFLMFGGWVNRDQQTVIDYLLEERHVLLEKLGGKRKLRFTDAQRQRLTAKSKLLAANCSSSSAPLLRQMRSSAGTCG